MKLKRLGIRLQSESRVGQNAVTYKMQSAGDFGAEFQAFNYKIYEFAFQRLVLHKWTN